MVKNRKATKAYKELHADLLTSLKIRDMVEQVYTDKVEEYMGLWCQLKDLDEDIAERGVTVYDDKRGMYVENRSLSLKIQVSRQMLNIFNSLGFKDSMKPEADDEL